MCHSLSNVNNYQTHSLTLSTSSSKWRWSNIIQGSVKHLLSEGLRWHDQAEHWEDVLGSGWKQSCYKRRVYQSNS